MGLRAQAVKKMCVLNKEHASSGIRLLFVTAEHDILQAEKGE